MRSLLRYFISSEGNLIATVLTVLPKTNITPLHKYYISRVILTPKTYLKSASMLFTNQKPIAPLSGLSIEILCIIVAQGAAKL